jgi:hypothetical protein
MAPRILLLLPLAAATYPLMFTAAGNIETIGKYYFRPSQTSSRAKCSRVSALLASRLSAHYTCNKLGLSDGLSTSCSSPHGPKFMLFRTLRECEQEKNRNNNI